MIELVLAAAKRIESSAADEGVALVDVVEAARRWLKMDGGTETAVLSDDI